MLSTHKRKFYAETNPALALKTVEKKIRFSTTPQQVVIYTFKFVIFLHGFVFFSSRTLISSFCVLKSGRGLLFTHLQRLSAVYLWEESHFVVVVVVVGVISTLWPPLPYSFRRYHRQIGVKSFLEISRYFSLNAISFEQIWSWGMSSTIPRAGIERFFVLIPCTLTSLCNSKHVTRVPGGVWWQNVLIINAQRLNPHYFSWSHAHTFPPGCKASCLPKSFFH